MSMLEIVLAVVLFSLILNVFLKHFHIPSLIGYIITGFCAKVFFGFSLSHELEQFAEYGVLFLMFMIGLEFSVSHLISMRREVLFLGLLEVLSVAAIFTYIASMRNIPIHSAIVIGLALSLSSTAIVIKILQDKKALDRQHGRVSLGILLFQDIAVIPILIYLSILANPNAQGMSVISDTLMNTLAVLGIIYIFGKYAVNILLRYVARSGSSELFMVAVLAIALLTAYVAHLFGVSYSLSAFLTGMMLSESRYKYQIEGELHPFRDIFLGLFFLCVGLTIDPLFLFSHFFEAIALGIGIMTIKTMIIYGIVRIDFSGRTAIKSAMLLSQVGEFSFVILSFTLSHTLLSHDMAQYLISAIVVSMFVTPFLARYITSISYYFVAGDKEETWVSETTQGHIIVIGFGTTGKRVIEELQRQKQTYICLETQRDLVYDGQTKGINVVFANALKRNVLEKVHAEHAKALILTIDKSEELMKICELAGRKYPHLDIIVGARNKKDTELLHNFGLHKVIDQGDVIAKKLTALL